MRSGCRSLTGRSVGIVSKRSLDYLDAAFGEGDPSIPGSTTPWTQKSPQADGSPYGHRGQWQTRTPTLAGTRADEYNFFICPPDEAAEKIATMRVAAGDREVEATVMGPALVGRDDARYRERLEGRGATRREPEELENRWATPASRWAPPGVSPTPSAPLEEAGVTGSTFSGSTSTIWTA